MNAGLFKNYYTLTKPGIIYGNALATIAGFMLAAKGHFLIGLFLAAVIGLSFVIASACVFNNYIDREIDEKMVRTKKRGLVTKSVPVRSALFFASILGAFGFILLIAYTNILTAFIAFVGYFFYIVMYSIWKRRSIHGTLIGSIAGAVPPVVGYCAVTNRFDGAALLLFLILVLWQMPHSYAIGIFRIKDYSAAGIPLLPLKKGVSYTIMQMFCYIFVFIIVAILLTSFHYTGFTYVITMFIMGVTWLIICLRGLNSTDNIIWARQMFFFSLLILLVWSFLLSINFIVP